MSVLRDTAVEPTPDEAAALVRYLGHLHAIGVGRGRALEALRDLGAADLLSPRGAALVTQEDIAATLGLVRVRGAPQKANRQDVERAIAEHGTRSKAAAALRISLRTIESRLARTRRRR